MLGGEHTGDTVRRRRIRCLTLSLSAFAVTLACGSGDAERAGPPPNLVVVVDAFDARACAGQATGPAARLAREGTLFTQAYAASADLVDRSDPVESSDPANPANPPAPVKRADRLAAILSGRFPPSAADEAGALDDRLRAAGYRTATAFGPAGPVEAAAFLAGTREPFFVALGAERGASGSDLAAVLDALDVRGLAARTLLVAIAPTPVSAGTCPTLRGGPGSLFEGGLRLQWLVRWPGRVPAGRVDERAVVATVDLAPTLARAAGLSVRGAGLDGEDVGDAFGAAGFERQRTLLWRRPAGGPGPGLAARRGPYKLLLDPERRELALHRIPEDPEERHDVARESPGVAEYLQTTALTWAHRAD